ncbi:MAG: hypothetical protein U9O90_00215 [Euryarchaeota archaeon]|nr:hypothetical protein [Euryarchaeota archaeon]
MYERILKVSADERYDIVIFNKIPWYLRGEILENNEVIYAEDDDDLDFWLYKQLKIWNGMKRRQQLVSADDLIARAEEGRSRRQKINYRHRLTQINTDDKNQQHD